MFVEFLNKGEYTLYTLYFLLVLAIGSFVYMLYKKRFSVDDDALDIHKYQQSLKNQTPQNQVKKEEFVNHVYQEEKTHEVAPVIPVEEESSKSTENITKNAIDSGLEVYRNEIPIIEGVKPYFFEYFKGNKILIVEDNKINQKILLNVLKNINTPIDVADNGKEAVKKVLKEKNQYDLIFMDISMPIMDGIEATRQIREDSRFDNLPIVTVTAFTSGLEIGQMFDVGANAYLTKPLDIHKLFTVMLLFLDNSQSDISVEKEFEILDIDIAQAISDMGVGESDMKEFVREFITRYSSMPKKIATFIDENNLTQVISSLNEMGMVLDRIGAKGMRHFIEDMKNAFSEASHIEEYQTMFNAQHKALISTYSKYLNSI